MAVCIQLLQAPSCLAAANYCAFVEKWGLDWVLDSSRRRALHENALCRGELALFIADASKRLRNTVEYRQSAGGVQVAAIVSVGSDCEICCNRGSLKFEIPLTR